MIIYKLPKEISASINYYLDLPKRTKVSNTLQTGANGNGIDNEPQAQTKQNK